MNEICVGWIGWRPLRHDKNPAILSWFVAAFRRRLHRVWVCGFGKFFLYVVVAFYSIFLLDVVCNFAVSWWRFYWYLKRMKQEKKWTNYLKWMPFFDVCLSIFAQSTEIVHLLDLCRPFACFIQHKRLKLGEYSKRAYLVAIWWQGNNCMISILECQLIFLTIFSPFFFLHWWILLIIFVRIGCRNNPGQWNKCCARRITNLSDSNLRSSSTIVLIPNAKGSSTFHLLPFKNCDEEKKSELNCIISS